MYAEEVIGSPEFVFWARRRDELHDVVEGITREGIQSGEFVEVDTTWSAMRSPASWSGFIAIHSGGRGSVDRLAEEVAALLVRGLLSDPRDLPAVREEADAGR